MNRFSGATPDEREELVTSAIEAHRERGSQYLTLEADSIAANGETGPPPWIQYRDQDSQLNLDCTDGEQASMERAIDTLGGVRVTERSEDPEAGTNLRISVSGDDERVAMIVETLFVDGFGLPVDQRLWATEI